MGSSVPAHYLAPQRLRGSGSAHCGPALHELRHRQSIEMSLEPPNSWFGGCFSLQQFSLGATQPPCKCFQIGESDVDRGLFDIADVTPMEQAEFCQFFLRVTPRIAQLF
jgi:hypothetical protein